MKLKKPIKKTTRPASPTPKPSPLPQDVQRAIDRIQAELMRLTHAVDDAKRSLDVECMGAAADVMRAAYTTIDSWKPRRS